MHAGNVFRQSWMTPVVLSALLALLQPVGSTAEDPEADPCKCVPDSGVMEYLEDVPAECGNPDIQIAVIGNPTPGKCATPPCTAKQCKWSVDVSFSGSSANCTYYVYKDTTLLANGQYYGTGVTVHDAAALGCEDFVDYTVEFMGATVARRTLICEDCQPQ